MEGGSGSRGRGLPEVYHRRVQRATIAEPPPFPSFSDSLSVLPTQIGTFFSSLAPSASYSIDTPSTKSLIKSALYSFALDPASHHSNLFFPPIQSPPPSSINDNFSLSTSSVTTLQTPLSPSYLPSRRNLSCGHVFRSGESVYRCRECAFDPTCVLCTRCYLGSRHALEKHDVTVSIHSGVGAGCCDCGDPEAFKSGKVGGCKYHGPTPQEEEAEEMMEEEGGESSNKEDLGELKKELELRIRLVVDWMLGVLEGSPDEMTPPRSVDDIIASASSSSSTSTLPPPPAPPPSSSQPSAFSTVPPPSLPPSYTSSTSRGKARASSPTPPPEPAGPWSVILWNDEKHSFDQVIDQVSRATRISHAAAKNIAQAVDSHGRAVVYLSSDPTQLVAVAKLIAEIDLAVTVRTSQVTFEEQVCGELVGWLRDLTTAKDGELAETVAKVLLERELKGSRFQRLVIVDQRLWKEARKGLTELYVMLLGVGPDVKMEVGVHYAQVYTDVCESYLLSDREPENSIIFLGVQLFTVPSIAAHILSSYHFFPTILGLLYAFFTEQLSPSTAWRLSLPPNPSINIVDPDSAAFRQKRYFQLFSDLGHLLSAPPSQRLLCSSLPSLDALIAFLDLFTSMNPSSRAVTNHVEYESDIWVQAFNVTIQLGKIARVAGEAYRLATSLELAHALAHLLSRLPGPRAAIHSVAFGGVQYQTIEFRVDRSPVSFHHPLAWLWAEMCKNVERLDEGSLKEIGVKSLREIVLGRAGQLHFLAAMDHPLRVVVLVAQIRSGLWVRNGFGVRAQQLHYKEYALRENTYDQDVFFLQTSLVVLDPNTILVAILDRFLLLEWISSPPVPADALLPSQDFVHPTHDAMQSFAMAEEMVYLIILLVSDPTYAAGLSNKEVLKREIIHHLCLGPIPYSELVRRVSERFADDPLLEKVLEEVSVFKHPVGTADQGTFSLKEEFFEEVNPYFSRYSRNQREEADRIVREHKKKKKNGGNGGGGGEPVIVPTRLDITKGPFVTLTNAVESDVLHRIIFFALLHGRTRGPNFSEVLVDEALHLLMLALVEQPISISRFADESPLSDQQQYTLVRLLVEIEDDPRFKGLRHKVAWTLDRLDEVLGGERVKSLRKVDDSIKPEQAAMEAKRLAAKARQQAIKEQFARAQQSFLDSAENVVDEDEGGDAEDDPMGGGAKRVSLGSCIVCQDELDSSRPFGSLALLQTSFFIRVTPTGGENSDFQSEVLATPSSLDHDASPLRPFGIASKKIPVHVDDITGDGLSRGYPQQTLSGLHISACGHMMHLVCFETYYKSLEQRQHGQPTRCHPENLDRKEFVCPLCKSLGNALLPASVDPFELPADKVDMSDLDQWANTVVDPKRHALARGVPFEDLDEFFGQVKQLRGKGNSSTTGLAPWEIGGSSNRLPAEAFGAGENLMIDRLLGVGSALQQELGARGGFLPSDLLQYTLWSIEVAARGNGESASTLPEATTRMLQSLLQTLMVLVHIQTGASPNSGNLAAVAILPHLGGIFAIDQHSKMFYEVQPLVTLIEASAVTPESFHQVAAFSFYSELVQTFLKVARFLEISEDIIPYQGDAGDAALKDYVALARIRSRFLAPGSEGLNSPEAELTVGKYVYSYLLPFLRRASILQAVLFGVPPEPEDDEFFEQSELTRLLATLRIPHPEIVLGPSEATGTFALRAHLDACVYSIPGWTNLLGNFAPSATNPSPLHAIPDHILAGSGPLLHPAIYELVGLPSQLATLTAEGLQRECESCHQVPAEPALCLFCGQLVCHQSFCCMDSEEEAHHGECNMHMWTCGGSVGAYFLVKRNSVLYLYAGKGTFASPPYLDSHGEVLLGGRGRNQFPQFLHAGRYDEIRKIWLNHGIPTFVARKLEASTDHGGWETN